MINLFWRRLAAIALALAFVIGTAPVANAYTHYGDKYRWSDREGSGYEYHIPVCLHDNMRGGTDGWNLSNNSTHITINSAMGKWNALGRELFYYRTNTDCNYLNVNNVVALQVGWSSSLLDGLGHNPVARVDLVKTQGARAQFQAMWFRVDCSFGGGVGECDSYDPVWYWVKATETPPTNRPYRWHDMYTVAIHEFGHASALGHPNWWDPCQAVMQTEENECWPGGWYHRSTHSDDRAGFNALWPDN